MKIQAVRTYAMSMEAVTEEPHHNFSSFRVKGKIFVTVPPTEEAIHVFVGEEDREQALALYPEFVEKLGLRVTLSSAKPAVVKQLIAKAYQTRGRAR